jgi:hypothetical protein
MIQAISSEWGIRHDVIESPLTYVVPAKERVRRAKKNRN